MEFFDSLFFICVNPDHLRIELLDSLFISVHLRLLRMNLFDSSSQPWWNLFDLLRADSLERPVVSVMMVRP